MSADEILDHFAHARAQLPVNEWSLADATTTIHPPLQPHLRPLVAWDVHMRNNETGMILTYSLAVYLPAAETPPPIVPTVVQ
jgi:hypothetical protein